MDESLKGRLLAATPRLTEPPFVRTVVLLLEHSAEGGALGVVVNRALDVPLTEVVPAVSDLASAPATLFDGGPVGPTTAIALGMLAPGATPDGCSVVVPPLVTVDLDHDAALLAATVQALRVFAGYAGWAPGQLEGEIREGAWYVLDALPLDAFVDRPDRLWSTVLRRQGWPLSAVAVCPLDPTMN